MVDLLRRLVGVVRKEIVELLRQPGLLAILVIGPLAILLLFGSGVRATDPVVNSIIVAPPDNPQVEQLVRDWADTQSERLMIDEITTDEEAAERRLADGEVQLVVIVPDVSLEDLQSEERAVVQVRHNFIDPLEGQAIQLFTDGAVNQINDLLVTRAIEATQSVADEVLVDAETGDAAPDQAVQDGVQALVDQDASILARPLRGESESIGGNVTTSQFYAPAVVALILQHLTITFVALSVSRERSQRTTELFAVSPLRPSERVAGKIVAYMIIGAALGAAMLAAVVWLLGAPIRAGVGPVAIVLALELAASIGIGFLLAAVARNITQVVQGSMLLLLLSVFFGGLLLSPERLLNWAQPIGWILPMTHSISLLRDSMLQGISLSVFPLAVLSGLTIIAVLLGGWRIGREERLA
ncbi:MAG: ABC transporter permease [Euzebya sp.]